MTDTIWHPDLSQFAGPKYQALAAALRDAVHGGDLAVGARLPTVRDLAWKLGMTPGTVARAYQIATQEGLLSGEVGRGTFVAPQQSQMRRAAVPVADNRIVDLRSPALPDVGQVKEIGRLLQTLSGRIGREWLDYPSQRAEAPLRAAVVGWLDDRVLGPVLAEDVALANGGQGAIGLVLQCCLKGDRPLVLIEALAYPGVRQAVRVMRAEPVGVQTDQQGMRPDALLAALQDHPAQVICLTQAQNPTTATMGPERRAEIIAIARAQNLQIIEDDCYAVAVSDQPTLRALAPERTWYIGSLSKSISAALRFGFVLCPPGQGEVARLAAQHAYFALARPVSDLCLDLLTSDVARQLRRAVVEELQLRLQAMVNQLGGYDLAWQVGVPFVWLNLPRGWRASTFTRMAEAEGVLIRSADEYALTHDRAPNAVRIAVGGDMPRARFDAAVAVLARLLANPPQDMSV